MITYLALFVLGYIGVCTFLALRQDSMIFFPSRAPLGELKEIAQTAGFAPWYDSTGSQIGWQSESGDPRHALLVLHGNGGYALHRFDFLTRSEGASGKDWEIYLLEYPGYGARDGTPSEASFVAAALEGLDEIARGGPADLIVVGLSLGTGVASAVAASRPEAVTGLALITPFDSLAGAAQRRYPFLPVRMFLRHRFDSEANLANYPGPVAFLLAEQDSIVPASLGRKLFESYHGTKRLWSAPSAEHNDLDFILADWTEVLAWLVASGSRRP